MNCLKKQPENSPKKELRKKETGIMQNFEIK